MKINLDQAEQWFNDVGFDDAEKSVAVVIKQAKRKGFKVGWMATVNAINLP